MLADLVSMFNSRVAALAQIANATATLAQIAPQLRPVAYAAMSDPSLDDPTRAALIGLRNAIVAGNDDVINAAAGDLLSAAAQLGIGG